jgi:diguanylate cyclase (GGDEF)-like protein/PAS domain S-box-containing protein
MFPEVRQRRRLIWVAVLFSAYLVVLLAYAFRSQGQLRAAADTRLLTENKQVAVLIGDFLVEQKNFALHLAEGHEIGTFLINKALGMSLRYGLNSNLEAIEQSFRRKLTQKTVLGVPVYERILYFDEGGEVLSDSGSGDPPIAMPPGRGQEARLLVDPKQGWIIATAPVDFRGTASGTVMTVAPAALLPRYLRQPTDGQGLRQFLITAAGQALRPAEDPRAGDLPSSILASVPANAIVSLSTLPHWVSDTLSEDYDFLVRTPVEGSTLSLVTLVSKSALYSNIGSRAFLYVASLTPLLLTLAALWFERIRRRTQRLEAVVLESNRNRLELQGQNDDLTREIARRKALEIELRKSEERYRDYVDHAPEGIFVADNSGHFVAVNPSACDMVGYSRTELLEMGVTSLSPPGLLEDHSELFTRVLREGPQDVEIQLRRKDGTDIITSLRAIALPDATVMGFCVDITERKQAEEQIHQLAYFDPLTGLPNRRLLFDRLRQAMAVSSRNGQFCALLILDLDHFKDLNDTQGHDVGDRLITEVARRLTASAREEDTVARLGGDEYVIVVQSLGLDESTAAVHAETIAEKVHKAVARPYVLTRGSAAHQSSCSIGVTLFCGQEATVDVLLKQADVALYQAKNAGRNTIRFFNPEMQAAIDARMMMEAALRCAVRRDELRLYYQPQVDRHGRVHGAEALLRWLPPDSEPIPPVRFIPLAEETKLILPIGEWVLEQACAQLQRWQGDPQTAELTLSINVSGRQFHQPDFVERVSKQIERSGIDPSRLKLELTESVLLDRVDEVVERMQRLKGLGVGFSLDDFGTGYSSLSYLKRLPLDEIKMDQSFVRDITIDQNDAAIVRAVLAMSRSLGVKVIAEGVETEEQRAFLMRYGCEHYQGYLFGRPAPIESSLWLNGDFGDGLRVARPYLVR